MKTWIALFRGINVGAHHRMSMSKLSALLEKLGFADVKTYIQSGNAVFRADGKAPELERRISAAVLKDCGFEPRVLLLSVDELKAAAAANPFPKAEAQPKTLHLFFLCESPPPFDSKELSKVKASSERFALHGRVFYLHTPDGFGRSELVAKLGQFIPVEMTARNWRTVTKLLEMSAALE